MQCTVARFSWCGEHWSVFLRSLAAVFPVPPRLGGILTVHWTHLFLYLKDSIFFWGLQFAKQQKKAAKKLFELMKFRTIPNFRLTDLSLYRMIVLLGCGAFVLRARTPSLHQRVVLHDKGPGGVLPPRDVILAHEIVAQRRSVSKAQQSVRLLERHLFDEVPFQDKCCWIDVWIKCNNRECL